MTNYGRMMCPSRGCRPSLPRPHIRVGHCGESAGGGEGGSVPPIIVPNRRPVVADDPSIRKRRHQATHGVALVVVEARCERFRSPALDVLLY